MIGSISPYLNLSFVNTFGHEKGQTLSNFVLL